MTEAVVYPKTLASSRTSSKLCPAAVPSDGRVIPTAVRLVRAGGLAALGMLAWGATLPTASAGRTWLYLPQSTETPVAGATETAGGPRPTPGRALEGIDDPAWRRYVTVWRGHHLDPGDPSIRRFLGLPAGEATAVTVRRGRVPPRYLPWRGGQFLVAQSEHFEIVAREDAATVRELALELERIYWGWTQAFFPLWSHRGQVDRLLEGWSGDAADAPAMLRQRGPRCQLKFSERHRVVLFRDAEEYQQTLRRRQLAGAGSTALASSTGFYSANLKTSFFYPEADAASRVHEVAHQLFFEATDRPIRRSDSGVASGDTPMFWLLEGIAGYCESFRHDGRLATIGGWDSPRLQAARYRLVVGGQPVIEASELTGTRRQTQQRADLAGWYSQSIVRTHALMDGGAPTRKATLAVLGELYGVQLEGGQSAGVPEIDPQQIERFLRVDDAELQADPVHVPPREVCLAGCEVTSQGLAALPPLPSVRWLDLSRLPIGDQDVLRLVSRPQSLHQLSLEATRISPQLRGLLARCTELQELDLSWTAVGDGVVERVVDAVTAPPDARVDRSQRHRSAGGPMAKESGLVTLWLTGTQVTDATAETLCRLPHLRTLDVQRTAVTAGGRQRLQRRFPELVLDPLRFASE